jgi:hypothetical protein
VKKISKYTWIAAAGLISGLLLVALTWALPDIPHAVFLVAFWSSLMAVIGFAIYLRKKHPTMSRLSVFATVAVAVFLVYLLPQLFMPSDCEDGMPRAFAACTTTCVCSSWSAYPCSLCSAADYAAGKCVGCCWSYDCTTECDGDDDPTSHPPTSTPTSTPTRTPTPTSTPTSTPTPMPPVITSAILCDQWGENGWCINNARLSLSASQPQGHTVTISGFLAGTSQPFSCGASCVVNLPQGQGTATFTVTASAGGSASGSRVWKYDSAPPSINLNVTEDALQNGWYRQVVDVFADTGDTASGIASVQYQVNGGAWQSGSSFRAEEDGAHTITFRATDNAGHIVTEDVTFSIDLTPPTVTPAIPTPDGLNGWFISNPTIPLSVLDTLSGVDPGSLEYRWNSLDWTTGTSVTISQDGAHIVEARASDLAGNTGETAFDVRVDTVAPMLEIIVTSDTPQQNGWYVSPATATAFATDATSGLSRIEYQVNAESWINGSSLILNDGVHNVTMRASDSAGNQTETSRQVRVDSLAPVSSFAAVSGPISGLASLSGSSADATSGVVLVEFSMDDGLTWQGLAHAADGKWSIPYDTTTGPDGQYTVHVRATDNAGHTETPISLDVTVNNPPPKASLSEWWWIWESGQTKVDPGITPLGSIRLQIACGNLPDVVLKFNDLKKLPSAYTWNRRCGDGTLAAPGEYTVTLTACNIFGKCSSAQGVIRIPEGQVTETPSPTATPTHEPTPTRPAATPTAMLTDAIVLPPAPEPPQPAPVPLSWPLWLLPMSALVGMFLALGFNAVSDPRSQALRRLGSILKRTADGQ